MVELVIREDPRDILTQEDKIDKSVDEKLSEMGFLWDKVIHKLKLDSICFGCKKKVEEKTWKDMTVIPVSNESVEKGLVVFCAVCPECKKKFGIKKEETQ